MLKFTTEFNYRYCKCLLTNKAATHWASSHNLQVPHNNDWLFVFKGSLYSWHFAKWKHWLSWKRKQTSLTEEHNARAPLKSAVRVWWTVCIYSHAIVASSRPRDPNLSGSISETFNRTVTVKQTEIWHMHMQKTVPLCLFTPLNWGKRTSAVPLPHWDVTFIYIVLFTIQIVSKQLHSDNMKVKQHRSIILLNIKYPQLSKPKARQQWQGTKTCHCWQLGADELISSSQRLQRYQCHEPACWRGCMPMRNTVGNVWECQCCTLLSHHTPNADTWWKFRLMSLPLCPYQQWYSLTTADSICNSTTPFPSTPCLICHRWDSVGLFQTQLSWLHRQHPTSTNWFGTLHRKQLFVSQKYHFLSHRYWLKISILIRINKYLWLKIFSLHPPYWLQIIFCLMLSRSWVGLISLDRNAAWHNWSCHSYWKA